MRSLLLTIPLAKIRSKCCTKSLRGRFERVRLAAHRQQCRRAAHLVQALGELARLLESDCRQQQEIAAREHAAALLSTGAQVQAAIRHWLDVRVGVQP